MVVDVYEYFKNHPKFNKILGNNFLFVEYKCPLYVDEFELFTKSHLITYVIAGKKDWITTNRTYKLSVGDALFVRKGIYTTKQYLEEDYCVMLLFINDDFIKNFISENKSLVTPRHKTNHELIYKIHTTEAYEAAIQSMFMYLKQPDDIPQSLVEIKFKELLFNILLNKKNKNILDFFNSIKNNYKTSIEDVMLQNFNYDLNTENFATLCGRSLSSFKRDFKKHFKTTPYIWLKNKRLEYSKTLLKNTGLNINEVCFESGFKNNSHFIKIFKEKYNTSPNQYKKSIK